MLSITGHPRSVIGVLVLLGIGASAPVADEIVLVGTLGNDTVAVDRFVRTATTLEGVVLVRHPLPHTMEYKAALAPEGRFTRMEIIWRDARGAELRTAAISYGVDSIRSKMKVMNTLSVAAPSSLDAIPIPPQPYAQHSYALMEHAAMVILMSKQPRSGALEWIVTGTRNAEKRAINRAINDTVDIDYIAGVVRAQLDSAGHVVWLTIGNAPNQTLVKRSAKDIDIAKLTTSFLSRDTVRAPAPVPAPRAGR